MEEEIKNDEMQISDQNKSILSKAKKKKQFFLPVAIALLIIVLIASAIYFFYPSLKKIKTNNNKNGNAGIISFDSDSDTSANNNKNSSPTFVYTGKAQKEAPEEINEESTNSFILQTGEGLSADSIQTIRVGEKLFYVDKQGVLWLKYTVLPVPEDATDPGIGIAKYDAAKGWENINFGTGGLGIGLPSDVASALALDN